MTLDQALYEMELVGHDFYLFVDSETKEPSVVYRRHAYDYGVIHLSTDPMVAEAQQAGGARQAGRWAADLRPLSSPGLGIRGKRGGPRRCPWSARAPPGAPVCDPFVPRSVVPLSPGHEIMAVPAQPVGRCLGLAMAQETQATAFRGRNDGGQLRTDA
jgi:hypothetical protein